MDCVQYFEGRPSERLSLLIHTKYINIAVFKLANKSADTVYACFYGSCLEVKNFYMEKPVKEQ